jgi:hypothetical protein
MKEPHVFVIVGAGLAGAKAPQTLMRAVGNVYQFRHAELQDHLTRSEEASSQSPQ